MSSRTFAATLRLEPRPSRQMTAALGVMHSLAGLSILLGADDLPVVLACCAGLAASAFYSYRAHVKGWGRGAVRSAVWHADGTWDVKDAGNFSHECRLLGSTFLHPRLIVLHFRLSNGKRRFMVLCNDSLTPDVLRRLRARLRVEGLE